MAKLNADDLSEAIAKSGPRRCIHFRLQGFTSPFSIIINDNKISFLGVPYPVEKNHFERMIIENFDEVEKIIKTDYGDIYELACKITAQKNFEEFYNNQVE